MKRTIRLLALLILGPFLLAMPLAGCKGWTDAERARAIQLSTKEHLTEAETAELHDLIEKGKETGIDWDSVGTIVLNDLLAIIGSLTGVRIWRGGINKRNGASPTS